MAAITIRKALPGGWPVVVSKGASNTVPPNEYGYYATENRMTVHDLHTTLLHILGMNHLKLTYCYAGRDFRLIDVADEVHHSIFA